MRIKGILLFVFFVNYFALLAIEGSVSFAVFKTEKSPYIEISTYILGSTIQFLPVKPNEKLKQAKINIKLTLSKGEDIVYFDQFRLNSPSSETPLNISDVKRIPTLEGQYYIEIFLQDANNEADSIRYGEKINVNFQGEIQQSDIQLLGSFKNSDETSPFVKQGLFMETLPYNFYNKKYKVLAFYSEVYASKQYRENEENYFLKYAIHKADGNQAGDEVIANVKKRNAKEIDPVFYQIDISTLPSGNYILKVSTINRDKVELSSKELFFIRSNPDFDYKLTLEQLEKKHADREDDFTLQMDSLSLRYSLRALMPLIPQRDAEVLKIVVSQSDINAMRRFLFNHYAIQYPQAPSQAHDKYMEVARAVDKMYNNGFGYGFESDRGYFFLKYGKPDDIQTVNDDPTAPPYEIWFYNKLVQTNQSNVRFVFYNPSLIDNGHVLLHSTARGEWNNPKWEVMLYKNAPGEIQDGDYMDGTRMKDNFNRNARRFYDDF